MKPSNHRQLALTDATGFPLTTLPDPKVSFAAEAGAYISDMYFDCEYSGTTPGGWLAV